MTLLATTVTGKLLVAAMTLALASILLQLLLLQLMVWIKFTSMYFNSSIEAPDLDLSV